MKAAIVTFIRAYNYGATLQCYALSKKLRDLSVDVEVLDYFPKYFKDTYNLSYLGPLRRFPYRPLRSWWRYTPLITILKKRNEGFAKFIEKHIPLTPKQYHSKDEVYAETFPHDIFISGSDQVWSPICVPFDPVYFLQFPSASREKRYSYAASFGISSVPEKYEVEYKRRLKDWAGYCVREKSAVSLLKNLIGEEAIQCCDPTLLLTKKEWQDIATPPRIKKPYILVYTVNRSRKLLEQAAQLSQQKKLTVYVLTSSMGHESILGEQEKKCGFHMCSSASPDEWLGLFFSAEYILTDSFHGTVFSLIGHKKFLTACDRPNIRAAELLQHTGLPERYAPETVSTVEGPLSWDTVDHCLEQLRAPSLSYLQTILSSKQ